ncbi:MAG: protease complex subunit PrcB family protein [Lentimicrobiaceae bacterium]|nr:protease complex subunit PrcB family protein [Lentimicrobiaceae bacterium]
MLVLVACTATLSAQVTQSEADSIVLERLSTDSRPHTVYAKDNLQADTADISTFMGEMLELDYPCWIYYVRYDEQADTIPAKRRYFVVKESRGSMLMVNTHNNVSPPDLETWRKVPADPEPPLDSLVLIAKGDNFVDNGYSPILQVITTPAAWDTLLNSISELYRPYITVNDFVDTTINFSIYQAIVVIDEQHDNGGWTIDITDVTEYANSIVVTYTNLMKGNPLPVITRPFHIVKIPMSGKQIIFQYEN